MQVTVKGVDAELAKIRKYIAKVTNAEIGNKTTGILKELIDATPIDTGEARRGWRMLPIKDGVRLVNEVPYIEALNNGHSKQAPSHFIEHVVIRHGKALGAIVIKTPD